MSRSSVLAVAVVVAAVTAACTGGGTTVEAGKDTSTTAVPDEASTTVADGTGTTVGSPPPPTGTRPSTSAPVSPGLALQIRTGGGFVPVEYEFATVPEFTLYADGQVVVTGPTTLEFPGRALPNVLAGQAGDAEVRAMVAAARKAGVTGSPDLGQPPIADAPTTTFVLVDGGESHRLDAYALSEADGPGLSPAQQEGRRLLQELRRRAEQLGSVAREPYRAEAVSVLVRPYANPDPSSSAGEPAPADVAWPLGDLGTGGRSQFGGRCLGFGGADAERVLATAAAATSNARWRSGGRAWALSFRPELPGIPPCSDR